MQGFHFPQQDCCKIMEFDIFVSDLNKLHKPLREHVCAQDLTLLAMAHLPLRAWLYIYALNLLN